MSVTNGSRTDQISYVCFQILEIFSKSCLFFPPLFRHIINLLTILARPARRQALLSGSGRRLGMQNWVGGGWLLVETTCQQFNETVPGCVDAPREPCVLSCEDLWVRCLSGAVEETEA